jgi:septal ring factor EnvC (AmiA/AmiB activator)
MDVMLWTDTMREIITTIIAALIAYVVGFKKNKTEVKSSELDTVQKAIAIWQKTAEDLQSETQQMRLEITMIRKENNRLNNAIAKLTKALQKFDADLANEINNEINNEKA